MVGGKDLVSDLSTIEVAANELGLHHNRNKSEVISFGRNVMSIT